MSCCHEETSCHAGAERKRDYLLISCSSLILISYLFALFAGDAFDKGSWINLYTSAVFDLINVMVWGILVGFVFIALLARIPREFVMSVLGRDTGFAGILRATIAGVLLDLCSHGILMVGAKLYERGATTAQVMAFLIASPWNSFSFTLILWAMIGLKWMLVFLILSMLIALLSGMIFEQLEQRGLIQANPNRTEIPENFVLVPAIRQAWQKLQFSPALVKEIFVNCLKDSRMVMRWILFGVVLAALVRASVDADQLQTWFGATLSGLGLTLLVATIMEVCSEGTLPVAADLLTRARAPGNSLAFLMAGVSTDYTEIMVLKEATAGWKIPLLLPLVTLPQILLVAVLLNSTV